MYLSYVDLRLLLRNLYKTLFDKTANFDKRVLLFMEVWKTVKGFENYEISNLGRLKVNLKYRKYRDYQHKILKTYLDRGGYRRATLTSFDKNIKTKYIHRLVAIAFIENPLNKPEVNHINGIKDDNHVDNLEWNTHHENIIHAHKTGLTTQKGEDSVGSVLTEPQVLKIRALKKDFTFKELAEKYNVASSTIAAAVYRRSWKHI